MRPGQGFRVFDRADWRRKARVPDLAQRAEIEKRPSQVADRKTQEKW